MDAFYASIEQRDAPELRGRPVIVGGDRRRGVVLTASYEARPFGVRSAMPMARALRLCPRAIVIPPRMRHYSHTSEQFMRILRRFTPLCEPLSLDEAFLDVTAERRLLGDGLAIARAIKHAVQAELELRASVGVAACKYVAKVASDHGKPDGLVVVPPGEEAAFLAPLPLERLRYVGRKTGDALARAGLRTIGELAASPALVRTAVGSRLAADLCALARGQDERAVVADRQAVTIGSEETLSEDTADRTRILASLLGHADRVAARLRASGLRARVVVLKLKYADFTLRTRRRTLARATADANLLYQTACGLLAAASPAGPVRLVGLATAGLEQSSAPEQLQLEQDAAQGRRGESLGRVLDEVAERFGRDAIRRATRLRDRD
jgi:DNA polymerase-4